MLMHAPALLLLAVLLAACSGDEADDPSQPQERYVQVAFTMSVGDAEAVTRANTDWTEYDSEAATAMENYIDLEKLHVSFYDRAADGTYNYLSSVENIRLMRRDATTYELIGNMNVLSSRIASNGYRFTGKVVVTANCDAPSLASGSTIASGAGLTYDYTPGTEPESIPMWGVMSLSNIDLTPGRRTDISDIWLLRTMAKVEVGLRQDMADRGYTLAQVYFNKYNTRGYVYPAGYSQVDNTRLLNYDSGAALSFNPLASAAAEPKDFTGKVIYLPEYDNSPGDATITVVIADANGGERTYTFPFAAYTDGKQTGTMNIVRNHYYKFSVYGNPITIDLTVQPWTVIRHTPYEI